MVAALLIAALVVTALLVAASLRLESVVSTLLATYLTLAGGAVLLALLLSPFRAVSQAGLGVAEGIILAVASVVWWSRGRPSVFRGTWPRVRALAADPLVAAFLVVVGIALAYELMLALTVPPNNFDSLLYHLARAAAWTEHRSYTWIADAPVQPMNEFQPVAEQQNLYLFAATGGAALYAMPQYVAELAILVGIFGCARRLGFGLRGAACSALLFATFSSVALEATTAQNDLVAAAFALVAAYFLLSSRATEFALAGAAVGVGVGVKLTVALVLPVLALLALRRGPRRFGTFAAGAAAGFALIGMWGYVLNVIHTGHVLGHGGGRVEWQSSPAWPSTFVTALHLAYRMFDLSAVSYRLAYILAGAGAGVALLVIALRRVSWREEALVGLPFLAPALMVAGADAVAGIAHGFGYSFYDAVFGSGPNHSANEDTSAFGPLGAMVVLGAPAAAVVRTDGRRRLLAVAPIVFVLLLVLDSKYNPWLTRFLLVPGALATPLAAGVLRRRWLGWGTLVVAAIVV
ncbi:MAG: DUF2029 domain-containing protein, partial [Actinobacteria bacterium]|nr:DUF2029 domain-containing protein [Actinomycetota bacterium]